MSITSSQRDLPQGMSLDLRSLDRLKAASGKTPNSAIRDAAKQLESLFMQELLKSMRATTMDTGMLDNSGTEMGNSLLDTQLAGQMTGLPGGLSDAIVKQLERQLGQIGKGNSTAAQSLVNGLGAQGVRYEPDQGLRNTPSAATAAATSASSAQAGLSKSEQFVRKHQAAAQEAAAASGLDASHILGQAALESGWGKHEIRMADGRSSHNLFGIKATADWKGQVAEVTTTEYIGGVARKVTAKFRAYDSYADAFKDHARLLTKSPRYTRQLANADTAQQYATGLQRAGYATDPSYADKLTKVINTTLRLQRTTT
jgi:peptidoglycan hydrolase FlgJ